MADYSQDGSPIKQVEQVGNADSKSGVEMRRHWFRFALRSREPYERTAYKSLMFWGGNQHIEVADDMRANVTRARLLMPPGCEQTIITENRIPERVRQIITSLTDNRPDIICDQLSSDPQHQALAQLGTSVLKWRDDVDEEAVKSEEELLWAIGTPEVYRGTIYNADGKDLDTRVLSFFNVLKDPNSPDWPPRWCIVFKAFHIDEIRQRYGAAASKVEAENVADEMRYLDRLAMNVVMGRQTMREPLKEHALVREAFIPPCKKYPNGWVWVDCGDYELAAHELQGRKKGIWPIQKTGWLPVPARMYDVSLVEMLISPQNEYNSLVSQTNEAIYREMRNDIAIRGNAAAGAIIGQELIDEESGQKQITIPPGIDQFEFIRYNLNYPALADREDRKVRTMDEVAGTSKPTLGQPLARQVRVTELLMAREQDSAALGFHSARYARQLLCPVAETKIALMSAYFKTWRELPGGENDVQVFLGDWLEDVGRIRAVPVPHMTPALKMQAEAQAYEQALMGPYQSPMQEWAARTTLRRRGLSDLEVEIAKTYGSYEDLCALVEQLSGQQKAMALAQSEMMIQQASMAVQGGQQQAQPGQQALPPGGMAA